MNTVTCLPVTCLPDGLLIRLYIQPAASRNQIIGLHGQELKITITASAVSGQANAHLIKFIARQFRVAKNHITIEKGQLGRHKQLKILNPREIPSAISALVGYPQHAASP